MYKFLLVSLLLVTNLLSAYCQESKPQPGTMPYGEIDTADLKLTVCDFEKNANAMVLFDKGEASYNFQTNSVEILRHRRIKILSDNGANEANIRLEYQRDEEITDVEAETINWDGVGIQYIPVEKKLIYREKTDKDTRAIVFTFPNVKKGSIIEYTYKWAGSSSYNWPDWRFQSEIPTRYSEINSTGSYLLVAFSHVIRGYEKLTKDSKKMTRDTMSAVWALSNIKGYQHEAFMEYDAESVPRMQFASKNFRWDDLPGFAMADKDFGKQLDIKLIGQQTIIDKVDRLKTEREKVAWLYSMVRSEMNWNKVNRWYTVDGVEQAWKKKMGNSTEINLILYHFLKLAGIKAQLVITCPRDYGRIDPLAITLANLRKTDIYCPVDSSTNYILDASSRNNIFSNVPYEINGVNVFLINPANKNHKLMALPSGISKQIINVSADIGPDGKIKGNLNTTSYDYGRYLFLTRYKDMGEKAYTEEIQNDNPGLKISSLKLQNLEIDSLPIIQHIEFGYDMPEPDGNYLYINPSQFTSFPKNPFLSETRTAYIDFGCLNTYSISGQYKLPQGYKIDVLPKNQLLEMPDKSISIQRVASVQDGNISLQYLIVYHRALFRRQEYPAIHEFYKKMYELLNEPIVLKKS